MFSMLVILYYYLYHTYKHTRNINHNSLHNKHIQTNDQYITVLTNIYNKYTHKLNNIVNTTNNQSSLINLLNSYLVLQIWNDYHQIQNYQLLPTTYTRNYQCNYNLHHTLLYQLTTKFQCLFDTITHQCQKVRISWTNHPFFKIKNPTFIMFDTPPDPGKPPTVDVKKTLGENKMSCIQYDIDRN